MVLTEILETNAAERPEKIALTMRMGYRTLFLSYRDVYKLSLNMACFLAHHGIGKGDKVLILAPNSPDWVLVFWGALLRAAAVVPLTIQSTPDMIRKIADATEAKILFKAAHVKTGLPSGLLVFDLELVREEIANLDCLHVPKAPLQEDDVIEILYTSGTTGEPKGVLLTSRNLFSNLTAVSESIPISEHDVFLSILPLSHIFEQVVGFLLPFMAGAGIVYAHSPAAIQGLLKEYGITKMAAVPEFLRVMMSRIEAKAEAGGKKKLFEILMRISSGIGLKPIQRLLFYEIHQKFGGRFQTVASGGAPLDPELEKKWDALGVTLLQGYGLTETSPVVSTNTYANRRMKSVGKILPGVTVKIAEDGELLIKGPGVFQGYFKNEAKTKEAFTTDGWFKSGDIGVFDKEGFLYLKGRKKYMIKGPGAQNVYPEDIEVALNAVPGVKDSAVVGLEKPDGQVEIHAVILPDQEILAGMEWGEKIITEANKQLASYQHITGWSVWPEDDFPRSATRKVKKEEVLKWLKLKSMEPFMPVQKKAEAPLVKLLAEITGAGSASITDQTKIVPELHLDSLLRIIVISRIEEVFGVLIEERAITSRTTVAELTRMIQSAPPAEEKRRFKKWLISRWSVALRMILQSLIVFPLARLAVTLEVRGRESLHGLKLPAIFMPNHLSYLDSVVVAMALPFHIRKKLSYAAAQDVLYEYDASVRLLAELVFNPFPFPRREGENIRAGLEYAGRMLDRNFSVVVYPEGRVSETGNLGPLKRGAGLLAVEMDSYIVPVKISGTNHIMPYGKFFPRKRGAVTVTFGTPVKFGKKYSYIEATEKIDEILRRL